MELGNLRTKDVSSEISGSGNSDPGITRGKRWKRECLFRRNIQLLFFQLQKQFRMCCNAYNSRTACIPLPLPEKAFFFFFYSFLDSALRSIELLNANPGTDREFKAMCLGLWKQSQGGSMG